MGKTIRIQAMDTLVLEEQALRHLLESEPDFELAPTANCEAICNLDCMASGPDVLIISEDQGNVSVLECIRKILTRHPGVKILVLCRHPDMATCRQAMRLGAMGYVSKQAPFSVLAYAIRELAQGRQFVDRDLAPEAVLGEDDPVQNLSRREHEVLHMVLNGKTHEEIAKLLNLSANTVSNHRSHIMHKLNVRNHIELVRLAIRKKWIES